jgi:uncharacterized protein
LNYLCAGWKDFFHHSGPAIETLATLMRQGRPAKEVMQVLAAEKAARETAFDQTGRNDPCPCGSGRKFKHCHDRK